MSDRADRSDPENLVRHGASVRALAATILGDRAAAEDVAQESVLAALSGGAASARDPGAWLRGVGRNLARRWLRTESRRRRREAARPVPAAVASPAETAARLETEARLTAAVRALPEPYRTVVVLRYFDGLSTAETAARTGAPEATVKTRLRRALAMLRDALDDRYGARGAWLPLLVRVARPRGPAPGIAAAGALASLAGGAIMAKKILVVAAVLAALAAVVVVPSITDRGAPEAPPDGTPVVDGLPEVPDAAGSTVATAPAAGTTVPSPAATGAAETFRVVVRNPDGTAAEKARVRLVLADGSVAGEASTDGDGAASLPATGGSTEIRVFASGAAPVTREVAALADSEVVVDLPLGAVVSGTLFVNDAPGAGIEVHLQSLDESVSGQMIATTDDRGRFRFTGLPVGARLSFFAGWEYWFVDPPGEETRDQSVHLVAPATDLALRALRYPSVRGRVVRPDGTPVGGAVLTLEYRSQFGGGSCRANAADDGAFEVTAIGARGELSSLTLTVGEPDGEAREKLEPDRARFGGGTVDLGRIVLRPARSFQFVIRGPDGKPVPGAVVIPADDSPGASEPTGDDGRTELAVPAATTAVRAGALGYGVAEVPLPDAPDGPVEVALPGGTLLTVRVRTEDGAVPEHLGLVLESGPRILEGPNEDGEPIYAKAGGAYQFSAQWEDDRHRYDYQFPKDGAVRIAGILPGVPFRVTVHDRLAARALGNRELILVSREHREVDLPVSVVERTLVVRVTDADRRPVAGANVIARTLGRPLWAVTDEAGVARFEAIRGEEVRMIVRGAGAVPYVRTLAVASLPEELPVALRPGRTVRLIVTDLSGTPAVCEGAEGHAPGLDYEFEGYEEDVGRYRFTALPESEVRLSARYAGGIYDVVADGSTSEARLTVPATGSVVVRFEGTLDEPTSHQIRLTPTAGSSGDAVIGDVGYVPDQDEWEIRIPAILPGRYRVTLEHWSDHDEAGEDVYETCRTGPVIEVVSGRETKAHIPR